jgi:carbonic anhydrase
MRHPEQADALSPGDFIGRWMQLLSPAAEALPSRGDEPDAAYAERLAHASIRNSIENLLTFPCVNILHGKGNLALHGAMFDVATGQLTVL